MNEMLDPRLTTKIVSSYVRHHTVATNQVSELITSGASSPWSAWTARSDPRSSRSRGVGAAICAPRLCGLPGLQLPGQDAATDIATRHGLNRDDYLKRWGLKSDHPLTAPSYSERRSMLAKELGLGRKAAADVAPAAISPARVSADANPKSKAKRTRGRSTRSASKSAGAAKGAAPRSARKRPPRSRREDNPSPVERT